MNPRPTPGGGLVGSQLFSNECRSPAYPHGVWRTPTAVEDTNQRSMITIAEIARSQAAEHPDKAAIVCDDRTLTYGELHEESPGSPTH